MKSYITVDEILKRKHFEHTEVVAGANGLNRHLKWVHVVEAVQSSHLLKGNELVLTTGLGWKEEPADLYLFVERLIAYRAAGLCIEMNTYIKEIPHQVIDLANLHRFPIILFHQEVLFVEITEDIHSLIINKQYQLLSDLEKYSQKLNEMMLEAEHHDQFLTLLQSYLDVQIVTLFKNGNVECIPNISKGKKTKILNTLKLSVGKTMKKPVQILGDSYAEVLIISNDRELNDFDSLILDRTTTILGQFWLRDLYVSEKKLDKESEWLTEWIHGEIQKDVLMEQLTSNGISASFTGGIVWLCRGNKRGRSFPSKELTYFKLITRTTFEQFGFYVFFIEANDHLVAITLDKRNSDNWKQRLTKAFHRMKIHDSQSRKSFSELIIGAGQYVKKLTDIHRSYLTAKETFDLQDYIDDKNKSYFYQDLHMFRMLTLLKKEANLEETVNEYLEPVIEYDKKYNGELLITLKTYLECNGSKQETSKRLFIVRQTLYHRIEKLEAILGRDFMNAKKRLELEFMLLAYEFLSNNKHQLYYLSPARN